MTAVTVGATYAPTNNHPEITNEYALAGHYADLGNCTGCGNTLQISRNSIFGNRQVQETCPNCPRRSRRLNRAAAEEEEEEEDVSLVTLDCEILNNPPQMDGELTTEQIINIIGNKLSSSATWQISYQELVEKNVDLTEQFASLNKNHDAYVTRAENWQRSADAAEAKIIIMKKKHKKEVEKWEARRDMDKQTYVKESEAHAATKKKLEEEEEKNAATQKEWDEERATQRKAVRIHVQKAQLLEEAVADWKEKNARLKRKLARSDKKNEDLCAGLSSAREQNAKTNKMLSELVKVSDKQTDETQSEYLEGKETTATSTFDYRLDGFNGTYVGGYTHCARGVEPMVLIPNGYGVWKSKDELSCKEGAASAAAVVEHDGNWKDGKKHGHGVETRFVGSLDEEDLIQKGEWCNGVKK